MLKLCDMWAKRAFPQRLFHIVNKALWEAQCSPIGRLSIISTVEVRQLQEKLYVDISILESVLKAK